MLGIELSRRSELPLSRQIYRSIRDGIFSGRIQPGETLPSTRALAGQLAVARNTVNEAYEMLLAEGYITSRQGAPTRIAGDLLLEQAVPQQPAGAPSASSGAQAGLAAPSATHQPYLADFRTGQPDLRCR